MPRSRRSSSKQEEIGLQGITDGEFRRSWWHYDFLGKLDGVELVHVDHGIQFAGVQTKAEAPRVVGKIDFSKSHPMLDHFRFLKANVSKTPKMTIPSPSMLHYRGGRKMINAGVYREMDEFYSDLGQAYGKAIAAFGEEGCTYLQLDDVSFAYLCDPEQRKMLSDRGDDPEEQPHIYAGMINTALKSRPAGMTVSMHLCRGNFRSTFVASGRLRADCRAAFQRGRRRRLFHGMGYRSGRRLRTAALPAEGQDRRARVS